MKNPLIGLISTMGQMELQYITTQLTGLSPFQVVYGRTPPTITPYIPGTTNIEA